MNCTRANEPPSTPAVVLIVRVFARPGHALDQEVALREEAHEHPLEHRVLTGDDPADLEERLLELLLRLLRGRLRLIGVLGHASSLLSRLRGSYVSTRGGGLALAGGEAAEARTATTAEHPS